MVESAFEAEGGVAEPIRVWRFCEAPGEYRRLSDHGGDEDWVALVPHAMAGQYINWLEFGPFGVCETSEHVHPDGVVFIGAHA